jgi:hypothetical protein
MINFSEQKQQVIYSDGTHITPEKCETENDFIKFQESEGIACIYENEIYVKLRIYDESMDDYNYELFTLSEAQEYLEARKEQKLVKEYNNEMDIIEAKRMQDTYDPDTLVDRLQQVTSGNNNADYIVIE